MAEEESDLQKGLVFDRVPAILTHGLVITTGEGGQDAGL